MVVQMRSSQERLEAKLHDLKNKVRESFFLQIKFETFCVFTSCSFSFSSTTKRTTCKS